MTGCQLLIVVTALAAEPGDTSPDSTQSASDLPSTYVAGALESIEKGVALVQRGADNYPQHRDCFSCHHQALPVFATQAARTTDAESNAEFLSRQLDFTREAFSTSLKRLQGGQRIGGRAATASYALWMFHVADQEPDEVTDALVEYLLKTQEDDGRWQPPSHRPPLEESALTCTTLAVIGLQTFADDDSEERAATAVDRAAAWMETAPIETHEDRIAHLWLLLTLDPEDARVESAQTEILSRQSETGGWGQTDDLPPDAYATGQAIYVLMKSGLGADDPPVVNGVRFLLKTQEEDGSWHVVTRSKPIQKWFDNGDPHGDDQFISVAAACWATAALAEWATPLVP